MSGRSRASWSGRAPALLTSEPSAKGWPEDLADRFVRDHAAHAVELAQLVAGPRSAHRTPRH
eukprot:9395716-Pyramimonas_sp.AAC.1